MKITIRNNMKKGMSLFLCLLMTFSLAMPAFAEGTGETVAYGTVEGITEGLSIEGTDVITVTNKEEIALDFARADESIERPIDAWWAGVKIYAPEGLTEAELQNAKYARVSKGELGEAVSFMDEAELDAETGRYYINKWFAVTPEYIENDADGFLTYKHLFDWYGNGFESATQEITVSLDVTKVKLDMTVYHGAVEGITEGLSIEGTDVITVTNEKEIALDFARADESIERPIDAWWAGVKIYAPEGLTEAELQNAKYARVSKGELGEAVSFMDEAELDAETGRYYINKWFAVTPEYIENDADGFLTYKHLFDWYGNGFESATQEITVSLDVTKINLAHENHYGSAEGITEGLSIEGTDTLTITNEEEIALDFARADESIERPIDAWWVGVKIYAPEDMTEAELKDAKYARQSKGELGEAVSFLDEAEIDAETGRYYIDMWFAVTPEYIENDADGMLTYKYLFDWDGNGFGISVQKIDVVLDVTKIYLDMTTYLGTVDGITEGLSVEGTDVITVTNEEEIALDFARADESIERPIDAWWAGVKIYAPEGLTEAELQNAKYARVSKGELGEAVSFMDEAELDAETGRYYINKWFAVTPEYIENDADGFLTYKHLFDWYGNGFESATQEITVSLDVTKINLSHENYYGTIEGITEGLEASGETDMVIVNAEVLDLDFVLADMSIGRYMDAWWVGAKILAPEGISEAELEYARYRMANGDSWSEAKSFWQYKDSQQGDDRHFITVWLPVTQEFIENDADGILNWTYEFDWDGNGFGISTQKFTVSIDVNKLNRTHSAGCTKVIDKEAKEPECLVDGNTEASHCGVCGLILSVEEVVPSYNGHNFTEKIMDEDHLFAEADCVYYDRYFYSCSRCDVMSENTYEDTEGSELLPHVRTRKIDEIHLVSPADCLNPAIYYEGCENCDTVFTDTSFSDGYPKYHFFSIEKVTAKAGLGTTGYISFYCSECGACDESPIPIDAITSVTMGASSYSYTGKAVTPGVTVKDAEGKTLKKGTDYTVAYTNNIAPGTATAKVTFCGKYSGTYTIKYKVNIPATSKIAFTSNNTSVKIAWNAVAGAAGYKVYQKTASGWKLLGTVTKTNALLLNLTAGTKYTYAVQAAVKYNGKVYWASDYKTIDTATTAAATAKITATQNTSAIKLTWSAVKGANGYAVYLKTTTGWKHLGNTTKTTATFYNLKAGTNYIYAVRSITLTASKQFVLGGYRELITATKPATPNFSVSTSGGKATVKWNAVSGATGYQVYYKTASSGWTLIGTVGSGVTTFTDSGYTTGTKYAFAVRAYKAVSGGYIYGGYNQKTVTMQ